MARHSRIGAACAGTPSSAAIVFSQGALYEIGATMTLFEVKNFAGEIVRKFDPALVEQQADAPAMTTKSKTKSRATPPRRRATSSSES